MGNSYGLPEGPQVGAMVLVLRDCSPTFPFLPPLSQEKPTEPLGLEGVMVLARCGGRKHLVPVCLGPFLQLQHWPVTLPLSWGTLWWRPVTGYTA